MWIRDVRTPFLFDLVTFELNIRLLERSLEPNAETVEKPRYSHQVLTAWPSIIFSGLPTDPLISTSLSQPVGDRRHSGILQNANPS